MSFSPLNVVSVGFLHGTRILKTNGYKPFNPHIIYFLIFHLIQKFVNRFSFVHSGNLPSRTEPYCKQNLGPILGQRQNERLKILFDFPENPDIIKLKINLIILMIPFFKKNRTKFFYFPNWSRCWMMLAILIIIIHFCDISNISTSFFDTETLFQSNKIDDNTNERYGSVYW